MKATGKLNLLGGAGVDAGVLEGERIMSGDLGLGAVDLEVVSVAGFFREAFGLFLGLVKLGLELED